MLNPLTVHPANPRYFTDGSGKAIDTLNDLNNVLWEIGNEMHTGSVEWGYHMIRFIHDYEGGKPRQHPVGMTGAPIENEALFSSPADSVTWLNPENGNSIPGTAIQGGAIRTLTPPFEGTAVLHLKKHRK